MRSNSIINSRFGRWDAIFLGVVGGWGDKIKAKQFLPDSAFYRALFNWVSEYQYHYNYSDQSHQVQTMQKKNNQNLKQLHETYKKRGKNQASKVQLVLVLPLIG